MLQNIGISEFVLIAIAALILFGPDKLPGIGRKLGQGVRQLRSTAATFMDEITRPAEERQPAAAVEPAPAEVEAATPSAAQFTAAEADSGALPADKPRRAPDPRRLPE